MKYIKRIVYNGKAALGCELESIVSPSNISYQGIKYARKPEGIIDISEVGYDGIRLEKVDISVEVVDTEKCSTRSYDGGELKNLLHTYGNAVLGSYSKFEGDYLDYLELGVYAERHLELLSHIDYESEALPEYSTPHSIPNDVFFQSSYSPYYDITALTFGYGDYLDEVKYDHSLFNEDLLEKTGITSESVLYLVEDVNYVLYVPAILRLIHGDSSIEIDIKNRRIDMHKNLWIMRISYDDKFLSKIAKLSLLNNISGYAEIRGK